MAMRRALGSMCGRAPSARPRPRKRARRSVTFPRRLVFAPQSRQRNYSRLSTRVDAKSHRCACGASKRTVTMPGWNYSRRPPESISAGFGLEMPSRRCITFSGSRRWPLVFRSAVEGRIVQPAPAPWSIRQGADGGIGDPSMRATGWSLQAAPRHRPWRVPGVRTRRAR